MRAFVITANRWQTMKWNTERKTREQNRKIENFEIHTNHIESVCVQRIQVYAASIGNTSTNGNASCARRNPVSFTCTRCVCANGTQLPALRCATRKNEKQIFHVNCSHFIFSHLSFSIFFMFVHANHELKQMAIIHNDKTQTSILFPQMQTDRCTPLSKRKTMCSIHGVSVLHLV